MNLKTILLNLIIGTLTFAIGVAWIAVFRYFLESRSTSQTESIKMERSEFDINDPNSVLPIDFEEEKLSDPKEDEENLRYFDPEGRYYLLEESKTFGDFFLFTIANKNFEVESEDERFGDFMPPQGTLLLEDSDSGEDGCEMHDYFDIPNIEIEDGKISFTTKTRNGISFEFNGEYLVKGNFYTLELEEKVLKGTLTKKKNGKPVAEEELKFGWNNSEICLH